jgi:hypothetical protein
MIRRRWLLVDRWTSYDGYLRYRIISRHWTKAGALFAHGGVQPFLCGRCGQASILLQNEKTGYSRELSTQ